MIQSWADQATEQVWRREPAKQFGADLQRTAYRRLMQLNVAETINDLRIPPGNRLEKLSGDRSGQHSIRVNDQFRLCFRWTDLGPADVELTDYH